MTQNFKQGGIVILDYGSQYTQVIARRIREQQVYAEVLPYDADLDTINAHQPAGIILSGGPHSVYEADAPQLNKAFLNNGLPILGICYGMQVLTQALGGKVAPSKAREYGKAMVTHTPQSPLMDGLPSELQVWMSHGDRIEQPPAEFVPLAQSEHSTYAVIGNVERRYYGVQFHPEVSHTPQGIDLLHNFLFKICDCQAHWTASAFIKQSIEKIQAQVGEDKVLLALSGGVDSAVAGALIHKAIGDQLTSVFVNTGMMRKDEPEQVVQVFRHEQKMNLIAVDATEQFLSQLQNVTEPEAKRKIIGSAFIDVFAEQARQLGEIRYLAQGTIYPDVIESAAHHKTAHTIKSHHNVGGLPDDLQFELIEPLRDLFKDEVRAIGSALSLPDSIVWRQPFPGPGLAIRCLGDITWERLETLRSADAILLDELGRAGLLRDDTAQSFAVLLPVKSVGVMGDQRTYQEVIALRAVTTDDFMTADWARLPYDLLAL